jgi:hypothetical protein
LLERLVIFYNDKLCFIRFVFNAKDLTRAEIHSLSYLSQQLQRRPLVENMNGTIRIPLLKNVGAREHTVPTRNAFLGMRNHSHAITSFLLC